MDVMTFRAADAARKRAARAAATPGATAARTANAARMREARAAARAARNAARVAAGLEAKPPRRDLGALSARRGAAPALRPFMGIDGEGCGQDREGRQHYMLMCAGDGTERHELYTGRPLLTEDCLEFILSLPRGHILTGFAFGYDTTQILRDLSPERRGDLLTARDVDRDGKALPWDKQARRSRYTYWRGYGLEWLPGQFFRVCRMRLVQRQSPDGQIRWAAWQAVPGTARTIFESFGFFQAKFAKCLEHWDMGTPEQRALILKNKAERAEFSRMTKAVRRYCATECDLLAGMMEKLRAACLASDIKPRTWNGAGKLAASLHQAHGTMTRAELEASVPSGVIMHAGAAYYGGRFEISRIGCVPGPVYEYDLNSAYPAAMSGSIGPSLPCLEHGSWHFLEPEQIRKAWRDPSSLFVATVRYDHARAGGRLCGLPHRAKHGGLSWRVAGTGIYWSVELRSAARLGAALTFGQGWLYERQCECKPFDWVPPLYAARKALGKGTQGIPLKLGLNSLYGKLAQRIGIPRYGNMIWAGLITATTRVALNDAIALSDGSVVMLATDGVYATAPIAGLDLGAGLGQWEAKEHASGLFIAQPGLYWSHDFEAFKTRGASPGFFREEGRTALFEAAWRNWAGSLEGLIPSGYRAPKVTLPIRLFVGMKLAQARGQPEQAGCWLERPRDFSFDWTLKRGRAEWICGPSIMTFPLQGNPDEWSQSHNADAALSDWLDSLAADFQDQPDMMPMLDQD